MVEDEEGIRDVIETLLTGCGYEVDAKPHLATCIENALSGDYGLITLDLNMPGIDGTDVAQLFERQDLETPVLIISGYLNNSLIEHLRKLGIRHFLPKPFGLSGLIEAVQKALR